jgi:NADPH:quinone reductase-like Zn-dependent oxidoreductase
MRAALLVDYDSPLVVDTVDDPALSPDGVIIRVDACGVCRSDWHVWKGDWRYRIEVSQDGTNWNPAVDQAEATATAKDRTDKASPNTTGRFVRVTIAGAPAGKPAAISEFSATGKLSK